MLTANDLAQFTGSETFYRHPLARSVVFTEGVHYLAEKAGAFWLLDIVVSWQLEPKVRAEEFQVWKLTLDEKGDGALVVCEDGNGNEVARQKIEFTDFPMQEGVTLWFVNNTILLPSEY